MIPLYILFPFLMLAIWGLGFFQGYFARKDREEATRPPVPPLAAYTALMPAPPRWEPEQAEQVVYPPAPGLPRHRDPHRVRNLYRGWRMCRAIDRVPRHAPRGADVTEIAHGMSQTLINAATSGDNEA